MNNTKLKIKKIKTTYPILLLVFMIGLILTAYYAHLGLKAQNKYIRYLELLNIYEKASEEHTRTAIRYIIEDDTESLKKYNSLFETDLCNQTINEIQKLGVDPEEYDFVDKSIEICTQLRKIETDAIAQKNDVNTASNAATDYISDRYILLNQQFRENNHELREAITNRMNNEISFKTNLATKRIIITSLLGTSIPILILYNFKQSRKLNKIIENDRELQAATLKNIADAVILVNIKGEIILFNQAAEKITGYPVQEALGLNINQVVKFLNNNKQISTCKHNEYHAETSCPIAHLNGEYLRIMTSTGEEKIVELQCTHITNDSKVNGVVFTMKDQTEQVKMQGEIEKSKRLDSLGLLAGGIAHDFNNTLTVIIGNIGLAKLYEYQGNTALIPNCINEIEKETNRAQHITKQILTFARGGLPVKKVENIYDITKEAADYVFKNTNIAYTVKAPITELLMEVDYGQMLHAFRNILINSRESIKGEGGKVSIEINIDNSDPSYVNIYIKDNGEGIAESDLPNIFDIYFTTKESSQGLGLSTTYKVIKNHDGLIQAQSNESETIFTVKLPLVTNKRNNDQENQGNTGINSILIMDDEESIVNVISKYLTEFNYKVDTTTCGEQAIKKYQEKLQQNNPYDLVILDLKVPNGMGGEETIKELLKIDPQTKAILASGYSNDTVMANYKDHGFQAILPKPYKPQDLVELIKSM